MTMVDLPGTALRGVAERPLHHSEKRLTTKDSIAELLECGSIQVMKWEDDDVALRAAAEFSRMPPDRMTSQEAAAFPDVFGIENSMQVYLFIRNKILQIWMLEPNVELTKVMVQSEIMPPFNSDASLVRRVHAFLERFAYINYGSFYKMPHQINLAQRKRSVIVIGAGAAGIGAASQLKYFGFDVTVIEARGRIGGRISTYEKKAEFQGDSAYTYELGAETFYGTSGNPFITFSKQTRFNLVRVPWKVTLYDGMPSHAHASTTSSATQLNIVHTAKDESVEAIFHEMSEMIHRLVHEKGVTHCEGKPLTMQQIYKDLMMMLEWKQTDKRKYYFDMYEDLLGKMTKLSSEILIYQQSAELLAEKLEALDRKAVTEFESPLEKDILRRCLRRDLGQAVKKFDELRLRRTALETSLTAMFDQKPCASFFSDQDKRILAFHFAHLEYLNGCPLDELAVTDWDFDDATALKGSHSYVAEGMQVTLDKLCSGDTNGVTIIPHYWQCVQSIEYNEKGVVVHTLSTRGPTRNSTYVADAVLVTVPLGVLKAGYDPNFDVPPMSPSAEAQPKACLDFDPPLPQWKVDAIRSMGYGKECNKLFLVFESQFWDDRTTDARDKGREMEPNMMGRVPQDPGSRGEFYLFRFHTKYPIVCAYLAGQGAKNCSVFSESIMVSRALDILRGAYAYCPMEPVSSFMTKWHEDPYTLGCFSHLTPTSKISDFDDLAAPVRCHSNEGDYKGPERVYFAGEHTSKNFPATVHGALLSGYREAGRIADAMLGCTYAPPEDCPIDLESDDDDDDVVALSPSSSAINGHRPPVPAPLDHGHDHDQLPSLGESDDDVMLVE